MAPPASLVATSDLLAGIRSRDPALEGTLFFGVTSTRIFCRPTCPARRPRDDRLRLFATAPQAAAAGFRACRRCRPDAVGPWRRGDAVADRAASLIRRRGAAAPTLGALAAELGVAPAHLNRVFRRRFGVTPSAYREAFRLDRLRASLRSGKSVRKAAHEAGYGSPSRLYERGRLGMRPGSYRRGAEDETIDYAVASSGLGPFLVATTPRGVCAVRFGASAASLLAELRLEFPAARLVASEEDLAPLVGELQSRIMGAAPQRLPPIDVRGTSFQKDVWAALAHVPAGTKVSYADMARRIGRPAAVRAVASAIAANPVAVLIPCHRVVRTDGGLGGFRWGLVRKRRLLSAEAGEKV